MFRVRVFTFGPGPVRYFLDPESTRIRWVSKIKTQTLKKEAGPDRVQQGPGPMTIPSCRHVLIFLM